jgi:hypothetical protein
LRGKNGQRPHLILARVAAADSWLHSGFGRSPLP